MTTETLTPPISTADPEGLLIKPSDFREGFPTWFSEGRERAWELFEATPMPGRVEEWRFTSSQTLDPAVFKHALPVSDTVREDLIARSHSQHDAAARLVFANDRLLTRLELPAEWATKGVIFCSLEEAAQRHGEMLRQHFMVQETVLGGQKFAALHQANVRAGTFLYVPRNVELALPLEVFHWLHGADSAIFPHTLLIAGENSKVTVVDHFQSADDAAGFACGINDLYLAPGAKLTYLCVQNWSRETRAIQINNNTVERDAAATTLLVNLGARYGRNESVSRIVGAGGRSDMLSVSVADGTQEFDQRTLQAHQAPHTASDLLYKNSLDDAARTIYSGVIRVEPGAHKTDAYQKVRNLLLSDEAEANSAPGLEIEADDVRCTHGATSGQVDDEELFYLLSRGITRKQAQKLIVLGFLNEVFERLGQPALEADLRERVESRFKRTG